VCWYGVHLLLRLFSRKSKVRGFILIVLIINSTLIPTWEFAEKNITATAEQKAGLWFQDAVAQMKNDRDIIGGGLGLAIVLAALWVQLMKKFTKFFI
jgi:hypothetical protein